MGGATPAWLAEASGAKKGAAAGAAAGLHTRTGAPMSPEGGAWRAGRAPSAGGEAKAARGGEGAEGVAGARGSCRCTSERGG